MYIYSSRIYRAQAGYADGGEGTQFTCFTSTKVLVLTPEECVPGYADGGDYEIY